MISKKLSVVALSCLTSVLSLSAMAQDTTTSTSSSTTTTTTGDMSGGMGTGGTMGGSMGGSASMPMSMEPMQASGTVLRYYTDRAGYVTAADVQTADGVRMVRFAPSMAQRIYSTYPVGGQFAGTLQPSMSMGMSRYDVVALGETMPASGMMKPSMMSDIEMLRADPFITAGSKMIQFHGKLNSVVTDDRGEVLALVLSGVKMPGMMGAMGGGAMSTDTSATSSSTMSTGSDSMAGGTMTDGSMGGGSMGGGSMSMMDMMQSMVLVRVPRELRHNTGGMATSERVSPLFKGADVEVVGYNEAPRYGVVSAYGQRVAASALVVNGRAVGAVGLPMVSASKKGKMMGMSMGGTMSAEETNAMNMGYSTYGTSSGSSDMGGGMSGGMGGDASSTGGGASGGTTTGGSTSGGM